MQLSANSTALVLIDLQKGVLGMPVEPYRAADIYERSMRLAAELRDAGGLVVHVRVSFAKDFSDALRAPVDTPSNLGQLPPDWDQLPAAPSDQDLVITKRNWGAFNGTELDLQLRRRGMRTIVLGGIATNMGVESTARNAHELGYELILVEDLCSGHTPEMHAFSFTHIFPRLSRVTQMSSLTFS